VINKKITVSKKGEQNNGDWKFLRKEKRHLSRKPVRGGEQWGKEKSAKRKSRKPVGKFN